MASSQKVELKVPLLKGGAKLMPTKVGEVTHYFSKIGVAIIELSYPLSIGETIRIEGSTTSFEQEVKEMQYDHKDIEQGTVGKEVGVKVSDVVREGDGVFLVE